MTLATLQVRKVTFREVKCVTKAPQLVSDGVSPRIQVRSTPGPHSGRLAVRGHLMLIHFLFFW